MTITMTMHECWKFLPNTLAMRFLVNCRFTIDQRRVFKVPVGRLVVPTRLATKIDGTSLRWNLTHTIVSHSDTGYSPAGESWHVTLFVKFGGYKCYVLGVNAHGRYLRYQSEKSSAAPDNKSVWTVLWED